jgi:hypothetical protein
MFRFNSEARYYVNIEGWLLARQQDTISSQTLGKTIKFMQTTPLNDALEVLGPGFLQEVRKRLAPVRDKFF